MSTAQPPVDRWWSKTGEPEVPHEEARRRVLAAMARYPSRRPWSASELGGVIWPKNRMKAQGLALAAGRIIHGLEKDGKIRWVCNDYHRGYLLCR